jgi:two-component system chemotaxis sensor kinase CheA
MEVSVGDTIFTIPITSIKQSFKISNETKIIHDTDGAEMIMVRGECYPVLRLNRIFNIPDSIDDLYEGIAILIHSGNRYAVVYADELLGEQQVVVKPFPYYLSRYHIKSYGLAGCTILGDGSISLILDSANLINRF